MGDLLDAALAYAACGLRVLPCRPRQKVPLTRHGLLDATVDPDRITQWWIACPDANVAVRTGKESGLFIVDIDGLDGEAALRKLENQHGLLAASWEVVTPRGPGRHIGFAYPPDREVRNSVSQVAAGVDVRGANAYVVCPPSIHPCGKPYTWSVDCADEIADAPGWLLDLVAPGGSIPVPTPPEDWADLIAAGVAEGARDVTITKITGHLLRRNVDPFVTPELMRAWAEVRCTPPMAAKDVERIVGSIAKAEVRRRSHGR